MSTLTMIKTLTPEPKLRDGQSAPIISRPSRPTTVTYDSFDSGSTILEQSFITLNARPATGSPTPWCFFFLAISTRRHGVHGVYTEKFFPQTPLARLICAT